MIKTNHTKFRPPIAGTLAGTATERVKPKPKYKTNNSLLLQSERDFCLKHCPHKKCNGEVCNELSDYLSNLYKTHKKRGKH